MALSANETKARAQKREATAIKKLEKAMDAFIDSCPMAGYAFLISSQGDTLTVSHDEELDKFEDGAKWHASVVNGVVDTLAQHYSDKKWDARVEEPEGGGDTYTIHLS